MRRLPPKLAPLLFGFILSGLMSLLVAGISTFRNLGWTPHFLSLWVRSWLTAWAFALPTVLVVAPLTRRVVEACVRDA